MVIPTPPTIKKLPLLPAPSEILQIVNITKTPLEVDSSLLMGPQDFASNGARRGIAIVPVLAKLLMP